LRNHGFLYRAAGWELSPAYDLNPTPTDIKARFLSLAVDEADTSASLALAFEVTPQFGLKAAEAKEIAAEVGVAVSGWRDRADAMGLAAREIARMESAFEHDDLKLALSA
jgi:serine/threonine-protein kinase HipA